MPIRLPQLHQFLTGNVPGRKNPAVQTGGAHQAHFAPLQQEDHMSNLNLLRAADTAPVRRVSVDTRPLVGVIREGRMTITPDIAARILAEARFERQRQIRPDQLRLMVSKMLRRTFHGAGVITFGRVGDLLVLVNGYHRTSAIVETGLAQDFVVVVEPVASDAGLNALYWSFDRGTANRTAHDVLTAAGVSDAAGISKTTAAAVFNAMPLIMNRFQRPRYQTDPVSARDDDARLKAAAQWWSVAGQYEALIEKSFGPLRKKLHNAQVVAVALVTLKYQPEKAAAFWGGLAENDGLRVGDPRKALIDTMFGDNHWGANRLSGVAAVAWNKWAAAEKIRILRFFADKSAVTINGTPFGGR